MTTEITYKRNVERIENTGNPSEIWGLKSAKSFEGFCNGKIAQFLKSGNKEHEMITRFFLQAYRRFHPETTLEVPISPFKGFSGVEIVEYPTYFQTIQHRKTDNGVKEIKHKIEKGMLEYVKNAIEGQNINEKVHTRYIAQEFCKIADISLNSKKRPFFDGNGWNFEMFFGDRKIYVPFNLCLKILEYYGFIRYYKNGEIERISEKFEIQSEFT